MRRTIVALALAATSSLAAAQASPSAGEEAKPVTRAELTAELAADYADLDANHDGKVDAAEIRARLDRSAKAQLDAMGKERDAAFARYDTNGDGSITKAEFEAQAKLPPLPVADAKPFLAQFDTNKDGAISEAEFRAPTLSNFDRMDGDKNGTLTVAEQQSAARARPASQDVGR